MDNQRLLVWGAFALLAFMTWQTWQQDYGAKPTANNPQTTARPTPPETAQPASPLPQLPDTSDPVPSIEEPRTQPVPGSTTDTAGTLITVSTDVFDIEISTTGGVIERAALLDYPVAKDQPDVLVELLSRNELRFGSLQPGLIGEAGGEQYFNAVLTAEKTRYEMNGEDTLVVPLTWRADGITIEKRFHFTRGSYRIDVEHVVANDSETNWRTAEYSVLKRRSAPQERSMFDVDTYSFDGPIIFDGEKSEKLDRDDLLKSPLQMNAIDGWVGGIQHHFLRAVVPAAGVEHRFDVAVKGSVSTATVFGPALTIRPGERQEFTHTLFVGPKLQSQLADIAPSLKLTVDYGFLTILSNPLFWLLSKVYDFVGNWGLAIIIVTIIIKLIFYKLTE